MAGFFCFVLFCVSFLVEADLNLKGRLRPEIEVEMAEPEPRRCSEEEQGGADASLSYTESKRWPSALSKTEK